MVNAGRLGEISVNEVPITPLRIAAGGFAMLVAWIHILHPQLGLERLFLYIQLGTLYDPRPPLFVMSAIAIFVGIIVAYNGYFRREIYAAGLVLMSIYIIGYVAWHSVLDHGGFWPYIAAHGHDEVGFIELIIAHLRDDELALASKLAELMTAGILALLLWVDR